MCLLGRGYRAIQPIDYTVEVSTYRKDLYATRIPVMEKSAMFECSDVTRKIPIVHQGDHKEDEEVLLPYTSKISSGGTMLDSTPRMFNR